MAEITLYFARASRGFTPRWLLEELGVPYEVHLINLRRGEQKSADYLRINPMGKVPALTDGAVRVAENPAICIYLADRYGAGSLAPPIDDDLRGDYLRWMVFATAVFEPAVYGADDADPVAASGRGWGTKPRVIEVMAEALEVGPWLLGDQFTAADVMLGSVLSVTMFNGRLPEPPAALAAYNARLSARPAYQRAAQATWG